MLVPGYSIGMSTGEVLHSGVQLCVHLLQEAAQLYRRATAADPNNERTWLQLGLLERRRGQSAAAKECFKRGIQAAPHNPYMYQASTAPCTRSTEVQALHATAQAHAVLSAASRASQAHHTALSWHP